MSPYISSNDPNLVDVGFDGNGEFMLSYNGAPFTGFEVTHYPGTPPVVSGEVEYQNGYKVGLVRLYHPNGILEQEYSYREGGLDGLYRRWDASGNLVVTATWVHGILQG